MSQRRVAILLAAIAHMCPAACFVFQPSPTRHSTVLYGKDFAKKNKGKPKPKGGAGSDGSSATKVAGSSPKVRARNQKGPTSSSPQSSSSSSAGGGLRPLSGAATKQRSWDSARDWVAPLTNNRRSSSDKSGTDATGPDGLALPPPDLVCEHFNACWGCEFERGLDSTPVMTQAKALLSLEVELGSPYAWRSHAKLAAGPLNKFGGVQLGLFEGRTHAIKPLPRCAVHDPKINEAASAIEAACARVGIAGYDPNTCDGLLRYVQLSVERSTGLVQATFVWNSDSFRDASPWPQRLVKALRTPAKALKGEKGPWAMAPAAVAAAAVEWSTKTVPELKDELKSRGLPVSGLKPDLVDRLLAATAAEASAGGKDANIDKSSDKSSSGGGSGGGDNGGDALFHSIWFHWRTGDGNAIFARGERLWHRAYGNEFLRERLFPSHAAFLAAATGAPNADAGDSTSSSEALLLPPQLAAGRGVNPPTFYLSPRVFRQANLDGFGRIIARIAALVDMRDAAVCELYGGIGTIGLSLLAALAPSSLEEPGAQSTTGPSDRGSSNGGRSRTVNKRDGGIFELRCSDENPSNARSFEFSKRTLPPSLGARASYMVGSAADALRAGEAEGADILIVDPPRKGLEPDVLACLCDPSDPQADSVHTLVYVSCGFDALAWQVPQLVEIGGWRLDQSEGFALFPGSDHIETLCVLRRTLVAPN